MLKMRVLIIADEVWNDYVYGNNVLTNWFTGMDVELAEIYASPGLPINNVCDSYFQITDGKLFTYGVENPINAIENLTATTLRNLIGELELDQTLTSRDIINSKMRSILDEATEIENNLVTIFYVNYSN